jgi:biopolymer transport protein ExbD
MAVGMLVLMAGPCLAKVPEAEGVDLLVHCNADSSLAAVTFQGERIDLLSEKAVDAFVARTSPTALSSVRIRGSINTPYRCIGGIIFTMQRAGVPKIEFITDPPVEGNAQ